MATLSQITVGTVSWPDSFWAAYKRHSFVASIVLLLRVIARRSTENIRPMSAADLNRS